MPAKAGIQKYLKTLDSRLRGNDTKGRFKTIYESINFDHCNLPFDLAQGGGELVEPFGICDLKFFNC